MSDSNDPEEKWPGGRFGANNFWWPLAGLALAAFVVGLEATGTTDLRRSFTKAVTGVDPEHKLYNSSEIPTAEERREHRERMGNTQ